MTGNDNEFDIHGRGPFLVWAGKRPGEAIAPPPARLIESFRFNTGALKDSLPIGEEWLASGRRGGLLLHGDNRDFLTHLCASGFRGRVNLVYVDPPFRSGAEYVRDVVLRGKVAAAALASMNRSLGRRFQYADVWNANDYLQFIYERLIMLRELLADGGNIFLHCDHRASHQLRSLLDEVVGVEGFRNEIVWTYSAGARGAKAIAGQFGRNHDVILWYQIGQTAPRPRTSSPKAGSIAYHPIYSKRRTPVSMARQAGYLQDTDGRWFKTAPRGDYTADSLANLEKEGRIYRTRGGNVRIKYFLRQDGDDVVEDVMLGDVWSDIPDAMHLPAGERTGFRTQKPLALLERIIAASSSAGDLVLDCFGGSGTTAVAAQKLGRRWICGDASASAIALARRRLLRDLSEEPNEAAVGFAIYCVGDGASRKPIENAPISDVALDVRRENGSRKVVVEIVDFNSPAIAERLRKDGDVRSAKIDWRTMVDSVLIDANFDGETFDITLADVPAGQSDLVSGKYVLDARAGAPIAVKVCDILGEEHRVVIAAP